MTRSSWFGGRRAAVAGAGVLLALVAGPLSAPAQAAPGVAVSAVECPTAVPMTSVAAGMVGEGLTVVTGSTPQPFRVEVLGVIKDGIGAGRDLVMIEISDLPGRDVVGQRGIWSGMSGSPVYVGDQLLGSVSYGFTWSASPIGGLTPAAGMLDLLNLSGAPAARAERSAAAAKTVKVSAATRRALGERAGTAAPRGALQQLTVPMGVSGLRSKRLDRLQNDLDAVNRPVRVYAAGGAGAAPAAAPAARPVAGGNFAAVYSSGDVTSWGVGTTTAVCGDRAVAFGHPIDTAGPVSLGAAGADSLGIVVDPANGSFKMANLGPSFGTVDQDRGAGLRADLTTTPETSDVTTTILNADTGQRRTGRTAVADRASVPGLLPYAIWANQDAVFDEWGDGVGTSRWTISGTRAGGVPFSISRANRWASREDVTVAPAVDVAQAASLLVNNDFEEVTIDSVRFSQALATRFQELHVSKLQVSVNGGRYTTPKRLVVKAGDVIRVRTTLSPYRSTAAVSTMLHKLVVPKSARGQSGEVYVAGGAEFGSGDDFDEESCALFGEDCGDDDAGSLNAVITAITSAPRNDAVIAQLELESPSTGETVVAATMKKSQKLTVTGARGIEVSVRR